MPEPILADDMNTLLDVLDKLHDTGRVAKVAEGRRIEFFEGKRKVKDGSTKKTGHHYWQYRWTSPDTGKRKSRYGGSIETVPAIYQYRAKQYQASIAQRGTESLADHLFRPAGARMQDLDTGKE